MRFNAIRFLLVGQLFIFTSVLKAQIISSDGNTTYSDTIKASAFILNSGDTLFLAPGLPAIILACDSVVINGVIDGIGKGYQVLSTSSNGTGPGGGFWGTSSGASGGGYGGAGGAGGYDSDDPVNPGGASYGTLVGLDIDMGSSGGSASGFYGGNGGGSVSIISPLLRVTGSILVNAGNAQMPGGGQGGGGGAGGGVKLIGENIFLTGLISAGGGDGSIGVSNANDDGGGGGGGRIKIFYDNLFSNTGSLLAPAGSGGIYGFGSAPQPGQIGSVHMEMNGMNMFYVCENVNTAPIPDMGFWTLSILFLMVLIFTTLFLQYNAKPIIK